MTIMEHDDLSAKIIQNRALRRSVSREDFAWFFHMYFSHYVKYETAEFQKEIIRLLDDDSDQMLVFVAFRGSGKSTIVTMAYVLWAILGKQQKKYAVIAGQTQRQARQHLQNIKRELESNPLLRGDLGPFREEPDEWGSLSLVISNFGAKITAASTEQSIRGLRHGQHRPDLIICDDVEDLGSVQTMESRDKTYRWFTGDVVPSGDKETRVVLVGNLLHSDSLIMRLKKSIESGDLTGVFKRYPLLESGTSLWPGKFPDKESIRIEQKKVGSHNAWMREYMLVIIPESDQVVFPEWIAHYETLPPDHDREFRFTIASADLAISESAKADCTAIVSAKVYGSGNSMRIYILPHPVNARLNFPKQLETMKQLHKEHDGRIRFIVEDVGYHRALVQTLEQERYLVEGVKPGGQDKRARLSLTTPLLKNKAIPIRTLLATRISWINKQRVKFRAQERQTPRRYLSGESHYFLGKRYRLEVIYDNAPAKVVLKGNNSMLLQVRPGSDQARREKVLQEWYRDELRTILNPLIDKWQNRLGVSPDEWGIKRMKTRWGTCNHRSRRIWLNLELVKKPRHCIDYVVLHEMVHLIAKKHDERFMGLMTKHFPKWRAAKDDLNRFMLSHEDWTH